MREKLRLKVMDRVGLRSFSKGELLFLIEYISRMSFMILFLKLFVSHALSLLIREILFEKKKLSFSSIQKPKATWISRRCQADVWKVSATISSVDWRIVWHRRCLSSCQSCRQGLYNHHLFTIYIFFNSTDISHDILFFVDLYPYFTRGHIKVSMQYSARSLRTSAKP